MFLPKNLERKACLKELIWHILSPPPDSLVISSATLGLGLSSSYSIHFPANNKMSILQLQKDQFKMKHYLFQRTNHFLAWPIQHSVLNQHSFPCGLTQQPNHKFQSSVFPFHLKTEKQGVNSANRKTKSTNKDFTRFYLPPLELQMAPLLHLTIPESIIENV